jgi:asparagine synthase (glutamine-hydrolysing)
VCGIAGAVGSIDDAVVRAVERMSDAEIHRGPDSNGSWSSELSQGGRGVALAHRRLAIIDLSEDARQPMTDADSGNVIVFNGEIYNFQSLRRELEREGACFRSSSDTEVVLKAYAHWGEGSISRLRGMFAFALWNAKQRTVLLARDRLGIKPLYLARVRGVVGARVLLFASELRALLASRFVDREADPVGLASYVWNGFVVGPRTIVKDIELLPAATYLVVDPELETTVPHRYWSLPVSAAASTDARELAEQLTTAVQTHLISDVPLGIFLSGGIDSSAVAALAVRSGNRLISTFNIGFDEAGYDESANARAVARALGTDHHELRLTRGTFARELPAALASLDQPTFDGINTYFVSRAVREAGLTVALAGTGGDELFGGYHSFRDVPWAAGWSRRLSWLPADVLRALAATAVGTATAGAAVPAQTRWGKLGDVLASRGELLETYQVSTALFSSTFTRELLRIDVDGALHMGLPTRVADELRGLVGGSRPLSGLSILELRCFLGERLLRDTDTASMASSLEVRVPFIDHEVVSAACAIREDRRFMPLGKKQLLREIALGDLDPALFDRPKSGFVLPIDHWARDVLKAEMTAAFADRAFCEAAGLDPRAVGSLWTAFLERSRGIHWSRVWAIYVLGWWCREYGVNVG